nr:transposase [Microbacterium lacticum]
MLLGLDGVHVEDVDRRDGLLIVTVSSPAAPTGCPSCGVVATGRGRRRRVLHDVPGVTRVRIVWRQRVWRCDEVGCVRRTFVEQLPGLVARRGSITTRAVGWAIGQLRREHATVHGIARQLGTSWKTVWRAVEPELVKLAEDESRFENVTTLGVDEHIWHHTDPRKRGPKELTGMVDLSRDSTGKTRARLLDLVPGRSGKAYASWLAERGEAFRQNVKVAALDPFAGYKTAIDDKLEDATAVLDAFHVVKLGTAAVDEVRRRVQQDTLGHRGRTGDPLHGIQTWIVSLRPDFGGRGPLSLDFPGLLVRELRTNGWCLDCFGGPVRAEGAHLGRERRRCRSRARSGVCRPSSNTSVPLTTTPSWPRWSRSRGSGSRR